MGSPTNANNAAFGIQNVGHGYKDPKADASSIGMKRSRNEDASELEPGFDSGSEAHGMKRGRQA